ARFIEHHILAALHAADRELRAIARNRRDQHQPNRGIVQDFLHRCRTRNIWESLDEARLGGRRTFGPPGLTRCARSQHAAEHAKTMTMINAENAKLKRFHEGNFRFNTPSGSTDRLTPAVDHSRPGLRTASAR